MDKRILALAPSENLSLNKAAATSVLQQVDWDASVQAAILSQQAQHVAYWGTLNAEQAGIVAVRVSQSWSEEQRTAQIQFLRMPGHTDDLLLYTRPVAGHYFLTLLALPQSLVSKLRLQADAVACQLVKSLTDREETAGPETATLVDQPNVQRFSKSFLAATEPESGKTFAIVWRAVERLPTALQIPVRHNLELIARANECVIKHLLLRPDLTHIVVTCPPGRSSVWAANLFKQGLETAIGRQFGVRASLWAKGHYAIESTRPLSKAELNLFLERNL